MDRNIKKVVITCPEGYEVDYEHSTFECIKFKHIKKELPKTWEEFCKNHPVKPGECYIGSGAYSDITKITSKNVRKALPMTMLPSLEDAEAVLALCQLIQLRDCYNDGWKPNWENGNEYKYTIYSKYAKITTGLNDVVSKILSFKTEELRDEFVKNFRELIEVAKPLL